MTSGSPFSSASGVDGAASANPLTVADRRTDAFRKITELRRKANMIQEKNNTRSHTCFGTSLS